MKDHIQILDLASRNELPETIDKKSFISYQMARELIEEGYLRGECAHSINGPAIIMPTITFAGRQLLEEQQKQRGFLGWFRNSYKIIKPVLRWVFGIGATVLAAWLIKKCIGT